MAQAVRLNRTPESIEKAKVYLKEADAQIKKGRLAEARAAYAPPAAAIIPD